MTYDGLVPHEAQDPRLVTGVVVAPLPSGDGQGLYVRVDSAGQSQSYGPCVWQQKGAAIPSAGTLCLLGFDQNRIPWVLGWVGTTTDPGG